MHTPASRDLRIDFLRGVCLLLIFTRHFHPNVLRHYTPSEIGFSDAAEAFIFLSGFVSGRAYSKAIKHGFVACGLKALHRCWQIYVAHLFTLFFNLAIMPSFFTPLNGKALRFFRDPIYGVKHAFLLDFYPYSQSILTLYIFLLAALPLMLWLGHKFSRLVMVSFSFLVYSAVQCFPGVLQLPDSYTKTVLFNPFAWQLLFFIGVALGSLSSQDFRWLPKGKVVIACTSAALALIFVYKLIYMAHDDPWKPNLTSLPWGKPDLEPLRLVHFALVAYLCWMVFPEYTSWYRWRLASPFIYCGQHSLPVFCFGAILTTIAGESLRLFDGSIWRQVEFNVGGWLLMLLFGTLLHSINTVFAKMRDKKKDDFSAATLDLVVVSEEESAPAYRANASSTI